MALNHPHHAEDKCGPGCTTMRPGPVVIEVDANTTAFIMEVCKRALENGQTVKFNVESTGVKIKRGESMWTAPMGQRI